MAGAVTVLHVSDMQFGKAHGFGTAGATAADRGEDSLLARIRDDQEYLYGRHGLRPDIVVASGDLANEGKPAEFEQVHQFLAKLADLLRLGRDRVVMVPGNHDVSWFMARQYIDRCEYERSEPVEPYWPKYAPYAEMFERFYNGAPGIDFPPDEPWTIYEFEQLRTVVAGLNSTYVESHRDKDHYGYCGEHQLNAVARRLRQRRFDGWLRIGVMHHNVVMASPDDKAYLHDADLFGERVAPHLDILMNGHTHQGTICSTGRTGLPVLCAGSAGVADRERAHGIPNQYQVIKITGTGLAVYARKYNPDRRRFEGDTSVGDGPDDSVWRLARVFGTASAALGDVGAIDDDHRARMESDDRAADEESTGLLAQVAEVCQVRNPEDRVERVESRALRHGYLRVTAPGDRGPVRFPVGALEGRVTQEAVEEFRLNVDSLFRADNPHLVSYLVHEDDDVPEPVRQYAKRHQIRLESMREFQGFYDFKRYTSLQLDRLGKDPAYASELYVPQRFALLSSGSDEMSADADLLSRLREWVTGTDGRFVVVLGDFGLGKSFLLRELTRALLQDGHSAVIPVLVQLRGLEKTQTLDQLLAAHLADHGEDVINLRKLRYLIGQGLVLLLLDGFDELAARVTYDKATEHLETIAASIVGRAKVVLTSRTQYFVSDAQVETALAARTAGSPSRSLLRLLDFTAGQVLEFVTKLLDGDAAAARERLALIDDVGALRELSGNPRMLSFIVTLEEERLRRVRQEVGGIAALYRELIGQWLSFEQARAEPRGAPRALTKPERYQAVASLAMKLWHSGADVLGLADLDGVSERELTDLAQRRLTPKQASHMIGSSTLLVRTGDERFGFIHRSIMEWFVADTAAAAVREDRAAPELALRPLSPLMAEFVVGLAGPQAADQWSERILAAQTDAVGDVLKRNALTVRDRLGGAHAAPAAAARLPGVDLRGRDLTGANMHGADLRGADLTEARLDDADFSDADLRGAVMVRCVGRRVRFARADLRGAELEGATLLDSDFDGARLEEARLARVAVLGGAIDVSAAQSTFGAALPNAPLSPVQLSPARSTGFVCVTWHPQHELIATSDTETVVIWDAATGEALRTFSQPQERVWSLEFSPDGRWLATAGVNGKITLRNLETGESRTPATEPGRAVGSGNAVGTVWSLAFSPDGRVLATADNERAVLWDVATLSPIGTLVGHGDTVWSVCFSADGARIALAGGALVTLWDVASGRRQSALTERFSGQIRSARFSADGRYLAAAGGNTTVVWDLESGGHHTLVGGGEMTWSLDLSRDGKSLAVVGDAGMVQLWDVAGGRPRGALEGHAGRVWSVCFSSDGSRLATSGDDGQVILWDCASRQRIRRLTGATNRIRSVCFSPDGSRLVGAGDDARMVVWATASGQEPWRLPGHAGTIWSACFSADGSLLAGAGDHQALIWDADTGERRHTLDHPGRVRSVCFSSRDTLATGGDSGSTLIWDARSGARIGSFANAGTVWSACFSPDGALLATGDDRQVTVREVDAGGDPASFLQAHVRVRSVCFSPDGKLLAAGSDNGRVTIWDLRVGKPVHTRECGARVRSVCFDPEGSLLAVGGDGGRVVLWHPRTGEARVLKHTGTVWSVCFSPDGKVLATGDHSYTRLWDVAEGRELARLLAYDGGWAAFDGDGLKYKLGGRPHGEFWWSVGLRAFAPGVLDGYFPQLRAVPWDQPLTGFTDVGRPGP